jgi:hypothetical protein
MREACLEIDLLPAHRHELRDAQTVPVGGEDERPIARTVAAHLARGLQEISSCVGPLRQKFCGELTLALRQITPNAIFRDGLIYRT